MLCRSMKKLERPLGIHLTSLGGDIGSTLNSLADFAAWKVGKIRIRLCHTLTAVALIFSYVKFFKHDEDFLSIFDKERVVYLTPDSENVLDTIDPESIYVMGGIVDHNRLKVSNVNRIARFLVKYGVG